MFKHIARIAFFVVVCLLCFGFVQNARPGSGRVVGQPIDSLHGVMVYYNGSMDNVFERNLGPDNYNLGLKYQCVEFVKRYYYLHFNHRMPETYGHAKDFFDKTVPDGGRNTQRDLVQYTNPSQKKPKVSDMVVYDATIENPYGHIAIISQVTDHDIEIIQQNPGPDSSTRAHFVMTRPGGKWKLEDPRILGWLRKE